jgi:hypothetical protein
MTDNPFDSTICWICDYWWIIVSVIVLGLVAYFTQETLAALLLAL